MSPIRGVDLAALVVVRVRDAIASARVAERLLRSGAFGLVVIDLCAPSGSFRELATAIQGRLVTLAQTHDAAIVCITDKTAGDGIARLAGVAARRGAALARSRPGGTVSITVRALKDKRRGPGWAHSVRRRAPSGL